MMGESAGARLFQIRRLYSNLHPPGSSVSSMFSKGVPRERKKTFSHKVRSGCSTCKKRRVKCDEGKPTCLNCRMKNVECVYIIPKAWTSETTPATPARSKVVNSPSAAMTSYFGTPEEQHSLQFWVQATGPWLANYTSPENKVFYEKLIPRLAFTLPATKHLMVAVAMMDERIHDPTPQVLAARSRKIMGHYNGAIKLLTSDAPASLDLVIAPLVAWLLETMLNDGARARMHLEASENLADGLEKKDKFNEGSEASEILSRNLPSAQKAAWGFHLTVASREGSARQPMTLVQMLLSRHGPQDIHSIAEARAAFTSYFNLILADNGTMLTQEESRAYLRHWELALLKYRHMATDASENIMAATLLHNLAFALAPRTKPSGKSNPDDTGMGYILSKAAEFLKLRHLSRKDLATMRETLKLLLTTVVRYAPEERHVLTASELLKEVNGQEVRTLVRQLAALRLAPPWLLASPEADMRFVAKPVA